MELIRTYSELIALPTFEARFDYLKLDGSVGVETFGYDRWLNQVFYNSSEWRSFRNDIIERDEGCDLGVRGYDIIDGIIIHHMNPITREDIIYKNPDIMNPEYVICTRDRTHKAIHYSSKRMLAQDPIVRTPYDTCPWRKPK